MMRQVIGSDDWGYGHTSSSVAWLTGALARFVGDRGRHHTGQIRMPRQLSFFKDVNVSTALVIGLIILVAAAFAGQRVLAGRAPSYNTEINRRVRACVAGR